MWYRSILRIGSGTEASDSEELGRINSDGGGEAERPGEFRELAASHSEVEKRRGVKCRDEMSYLEDIGQNVDDSLKKQLLTN